MLHALRIAAVLAASLIGSLSAFAQSLPVGYLSQANNNSTLVQSGRVLLTAVLPINTTTTVYYLKLYDTATAPTCGTDTPKWRIPIPYGASNSGGGVALPETNGLLFSKGLGFCLVGGIADNDNSNAATGIVINIGVQ